jgi:hypothetical protein
VALCVSWLSSTASHTVCLLELPLRSSIIQSVSWNCRSEVRSYGLSLGIAAQKLDHTVCLLELPLRSSVIQSVSWNCRSEVRFVWAVCKGAPAYVEAPERSSMDRHTSYLLQVVMRLPFSRLATVRGDERFGLADRREGPEGKPHRVCSAFVGCN